MHLELKKTTVYITTPELEAIRCESCVSVAQRDAQRSISRSTYGPKLSSLLGDGASNGGALHLTLGVDNLREAISILSAIVLAVLQGILTTPALSSK